jgi:vacuolar-type H+-ATPase subunit B/Vma2
MARNHNINGNIVPFTAEEEAQRDAEELAFANGAFDRAMADLRQKRNSLLTATDYLALSDNTLTTEMSTYRQALRDITNGLTTVEDVNSVTWPTKPGV